MEYVLFVLLLIFIGKSASLQEIFDYVTPNNCTNDQYFDIESLKCFSCDAGFSKHKSGVSCACLGPNKLTRLSANESRLECVQCKPNEYVSNDRDSCVPRNCFGSGNGKITCALCKKDQIIVTNSPNGSALPVSECVTCAAGFHPSDDRTYCRSCFRKTAKLDLNTCDCDKKSSMLIDDVCVPNSFIKNLTLLQIRNSNGESIKSEFIDRHWIVANYLCLLQNNTACQIVANMCVLSLYNSSNDICKSGKNSKNKGLPIITYREDESYVVIYRKKINAVFSLIDTNENNHLNINSVTTNEYGDVLEVLDGSMSYYPCLFIGRSVKNHVYKFGENFKHKCTLSVQQLLSKKETLFHEIFLKYRENKESSEQLYSVPILIQSHLTDINKESDINSWQLVKRFYSVDKLTGLVNENNNRNLKHVRYISHMKMKIRIRQKGHGERNKIYPPLLIINYSELSEREIRNNGYVNVDFEVKFELDGSGLINGMEISVGTLSAIAVLYSYLQSWSHARRSGKIGFDPFVILQFFIYASANLSNIFFVVSFSVSVYSFIIYKTQKIVYMLPPSERDEYMISTYLIVAFSLKIIELIIVNWRQICVDISFVDWDKPILTSERNLRHPNMKVETHTSFWRPYFVANEWNEIQTLRKISLPLHLASCVFIIEVFDASSWANIGVEIDSEHCANNLSSPAYQFAFGGLIFILLYFTQLGLSIFIYERFIKNAILDFMDVCSIANVSMLILEQPLYGYYLHGRSAHVFCNSDARGLQTGLPHRAFTIRCTPDFRMYYDRLGVHMVLKNPKWQWQHHLSNGANRMNMNISNDRDINSSRKHSAKSSKKEKIDCNASMTISLPPALEQREQASKLINKFLTAFFDHALEDLDYEIREKRIIERLLDLEILNDVNHKSMLLYNNTGDSQSFQRTIWYGQEWTLATFDLYLFCFIQIQSGNYVLATIICGIVWRLFAALRQFLGQKNLAKKTLIDERFLI